MEATMSNKDTLAIRRMGISVRIPAPRDIWESVIQADANALVTQTPAWIDCICAAGGYKDASRFYEIPGRGYFILPMVDTKHLPAVLGTLSSPPHAWGMGGVISSVPALESDISLICDDLVVDTHLRKMIRPNPLTQQAWKAARRANVMVINRAAHVLDLRSGIDQIWSNAFSSNTRRNIRKAETSNLEIKLDQQGKWVEVFYNLFQQSIDRWAEHQHEPSWLAHLRAQKRDPLQKFKLMFEHLGKGCRLWVAWHHNEPAAAILVLQGKNAQYTRGAMNKDLAGPTRANDLLHFLAIKDACNAGCHFYHMGETGESESLARFKSRFGAELIGYDEYRIERLPLTKIDRSLRNTIKKLIGFKDV
jgi:hypothetical protein